MNTFIPRQLRENFYRFFLIQGRSKKPLEEGWLHDVNYHWNCPRLREHVESGQNIGFVCGKGGVVVIDTDHPELTSYAHKMLPRTFTVQTGRGGLHFYFISNLERKVILEREVEGKSVHFGEIQYNTGCTCPPSVHANDRSYRIVVDDGIARISKDKLLDLKTGIFKDYLIYRKPVFVERSDISNKSFRDLVETLKAKGFAVKETDKYLQCHCPFHYPDKSPSLVLYYNSHLIYDYHDGRVIRPVELERVLA